MRSCYRGLGFAMKVGVSVIILAKDEQDQVRESLTQLLKQTIFARDDLQLEIIFAANGCNDNTAEYAQATLAELTASTSTTFVVKDLQQGGKSRTWNRAVHEFSNPDAEFLIFLDADVLLFDDHVLSELLDSLRSDPSRHVVTGRPLKAVARKSNPSTLDRMSLAISRHTAWINAICGSLYVGRAEVLRRYYLPNATPGEDGFLNALVTTEGFDSGPNEQRVLQHSRPTHFFDPVGVTEFVGHERRMIVGTLINNWTFELLHSREEKRDVGSYIHGLNENNPGWVNEIVQRRISGRRWVIPKSLVLRRFVRRNEVGKFGSRVWLYGLASLATVLTIPSLILANRTLRSSDPASYW